MRFRYIAYILIVLLIGYLLYHKLSSKKDKEGQEQGPGASAKGDKGGKGGGKKGGPVPVDVQIVRDTSFSNNIDVTGTVDANEKVELISQTAGNITSINFEEGSRVSKGQVLVKVFNADLQASLQQNEYQVALAKQNEYRNRILLQKEAVSRQEYETALSGYNSLTAQRDMIKAQIARTVIRAPFSGIIGLRNVSPGGYLSPSTSIATLVNTSTMKITFAVPERYLSLVKPGGKITFNTASSNKKFPATIYAIDPSVSEATRTITVRARAANPDNQITAGGFAKINLALEQIPRTIMVPTQCVVPDIKNNNVFVVKNGVAAVRPVETGTRTESLIEITKGLKAGDSLIVSGIIQMRAKAPLKIKKVIQ